MITAETLKRLISYNAPTLNSLARENGYKGPAFSSCRFLGMTNGGEFCYMAVFLVEGGTDSTKVFVSYKTGKLKAEVDMNGVLAV
jgi:hypothetical protein